MSDHKFLNESLLRNEYLLKSGLRNSIEDADEEIPSLSPGEKIRLREKIMKAVKASELQRQSRNRSPDSGGDCVDRLWNI